MSDAKVFNIDEVPQDLQSRVSALIPDKAWADGYISRDIHGHSDLEFFDLAKGIQQNIVMAGPTGSAKTMAAKAYAATHQVPYARVAFSGSMDPATVLGFTHIGEDGEVEWVYGDAALVFKYGGVLLLDEVNLTHPKLGAAFHETLDDDRQMNLIDHAEVIKGHPDLLILGAYNPNYIGTARMNEAFVDRFHAPLDWGYDAGVEHVMVGQYTERLLQVAHNIRALPEVRTPVSTRTLVAFIEQVDTFGYETAASLFVNRFDSVERPSVAQVMEAQGDAIADEIADSAAV